MIDPATFATITRILGEHGFTTVNEKLLAVILANVEQIQQCEIIQGLALHGTHCRDILKNFSEKGLIDTFGKRDIFYRPTGLLSAPTSALSAPESAPSFSPICVESPVNMLTSVNTTNKSVEYLEYDHHNSTLKSGGDLKDEFRNKVIVKFHQPKPPQEPVPVTVVNASAAPPETPLIDHAEKKRGRANKTDV